MPSEPIRSGTNALISVLDDFVCEAVPSQDVRKASSFGTGKNTVIQVLPDIVDELRAKPSHVLSLYVRSRGTQLSVDELRVIHDIAIERLKLHDGVFSEEAGELSRDTVDMLLRRIG